MGGGWARLIPPKSARRRGHRCPSSFFILRARGREPPFGGVEVAEGHTDESRGRRDDERADRDCGVCAASRLLVSDREADEQEHGERLSEIAAGRALLDTTEAASRLTRQPACANAWRGAVAAWKARERRGLSTGHDSFAGVACVGAAGDGGRGQGNEHAASARRSAWGTGALAGLLSQQQV